METWEAEGESDVGANKPIPEQLPRVRSTRFKRNILIKLLYYFFMMGESDFFIIELSPPYLFIIET